ncbi:DUF2911 domain-containing protein [Pedobacter ginsengisoli]|uniref:DUF2911 domain-containing protein n=1 Tax=Pedobacter ginsengisoli TaxID=363852 RepID=UPI00254EC91A|nr:DUF2911 domain-containing protein [Pedobacter ginsengisoli]
MKKIFVLSLIVTLFTAVTVSAQDKPKEDKSKRPSPPATAKGTTKSGTAITIDYSSPSVKGRTVGKEIAPFDGKVWRTGANEATTFEVNKDVTINGKALPAGKYSLHSIPGAQDWVWIFNKTANQWGSYEYKEADDALRVPVKTGKAKTFVEKMTFTIDKSGKVVLDWGDVSASFTVK